VDVVGDDRLSRVYGFTDEACPGGQSLPDELVGDWPHGELEDELIGLAVEHEEAAGFTVQDFRSALQDLIEQGTQLQGGSQAFSHFV